MKIMRLASDELFVRQRSDLLRLNQNYVVRILYFAFDEQEGFFCDHEPKAFEQVWLNDCIRDAGLVFQTDKNKSFRRTRALTANHIAGDLNDRTVSRLRQIDRPPNIRQTWSQKFHRMR